MIYLYKDKIIRIEWSIYRGTSRVLEDFSRALVKVFLIGPKEKYFVNATAEGGKLIIDIPQGLPEGAYSLETVYVKNWNDLLPTSETVTPSCAPVPYRITRPGMRPNDHATIHPNDFHGNGRSLMRSRLDYVFAITSVPSETDTVESGENVTLNIKSTVASYGYDGLSAYETAVLHGKFEGTEGEWLEWTHERIVSDVKDLLDKLKSRDTRFVVKTQSQRDNLKDLREGDEVYVIDDGIAYILEMENGKRTWKPCDYGTVTSKYILSLIAGMPGFVADRAIADEFGKRIVDEYLTRDAVRNYMSEVFNDLFVNNPPTIMDGMITVDMLSDAVKQLIGFGPIVNFPDDEFLTTKGGRITPKDRNYDPNNYSGMGRKILRKNMVNGVNVLTQKMMSCPNTIYVITYDYSLRGQTITVPENCVLQFEGGTITNGVIKLNNTLLIGNPRIHCNIAGTIKNTTIHINWFGVDNTGNIESTNAINNVLLAGHGKIIYFDGTYKINPIASSSKEYDGGIRPISNQILKFTDDSKLIIDGQTAEYYSILSIYKVENVSIYGVNIEGDISNHIGDEGEFGFGIAISSSKNINLYNCKSSYNWGDGYIFLSTGSEESNNFNCNLYNCEAHYNRRQGLSIVALYEGRINNFKATNTGILKYTVPAAGIDIEPDAIRYDERIKVTINNYISENNFGGALHIVPAHLMHDNVTDDHRVFYVQVNGLSSNLDGSRNTSVLLPALRYSSVTTNSNLSNKIKGLVELNNITISNSYMNPLEFRNMVDNGLPIIINNLVVLNPKVDSNFAKSMSAVLKFYNPTTYDYTNSAKLTIDNLRIIDTRIDNRVSYLIFSTFGNSPKNIHLFNVENPSMEGGTNIPYFIEEDSEVKYNIPPTYTVSGDNHFLLSNGSNNYWGYRIIFNNPSTKNFRLPKADTVSNFKITVENIQEEHNVHSRFFPGDKINFPLIYTEDPSLDLPPLSSVEFIQKSDKSWDVYKSTDKIIPTLNPYYGNSRNAIKEFSNPMLGHSYYDTDLGVTLSLSETGWVNPDGTSVDKQKFVNHNSQITLPNIIYKIVSDIDLNGATLTLPSGCTLDFQGGSFSNGTIVGNGTTILPYGYKIQNASLKGSFKYPDGINAVNSDGICLNNVYDVLDAKNLAKETISNYQLVDSDYSILPQFRNIRSVRLVTGAFAGFPTSVVHNDVLYCFYYQAASHTSTPGVHENLHYKYSSDNGDTWSDEKELVLPVSDSSGMFRSYRAAYAIPFNSNVLLGVFVTTSDSSNTKGSFTMLFEVSIDSSNNISIVNQIKVPILNNGSLVNSYQDNTITDSMIIGGNIIKVGSSYLFSCYTSSKANYIFSFDGDFTNNTHITTFDIIPYNGMVYTEHAFIKFSDTNFYIVFREDARRENTPIFKYNTSTSKFELFAVIDDVAYDGLDAVLVNDNTAVIMGRDWRNYYTPCRFALMNDSGKVYIDNAKYYGDVLGRDCGYCSLQVINNKLVVLFYIKTSAVNYDYNIVETEINVNKLVNLMYY